jgi:hypothetical protein
MVGLLRPGPGPLWAAVSAPGNPRGPRDPLAALSDSFAGDTLSDSWTTYSPVSGSEFTVTGGDLRMTPGDAASGFAGHPNPTPGPFSYKSVGSDFDVRVTVRFRNGADDGDPPSDAFRTAGIYIAASQSGATNWIHLGVGTATSGASPRHTWTVADSSGANVQTQAIVGSFHSDYRVVRSGQSFVLSYRAHDSGVALDSDSGWTVGNTYDRSADPMPSTLLLGPMLRTAGVTYSDCVMRTAAVLFKTP